MWADLPAAVGFINGRGRKVERATDGAVLADELTAAERFDVAVAEEKIAALVVPEMNTFPSRGIGIVLLLVLVVVLGFRAVEDEND